jgi:hypothetical protein
VATAEGDCGCGGSAVADRAGHAAVKVWDFLWAHAIDVVLLALVVVWVRLDRGAKSDGDGRVRDVDGDGC